MVESRSLSELQLGGGAGSVTQFLSHFSNLCMIAKGVRPRLFSRPLPLGVCPGRKTREMLREFIVSLVRSSRGDLKPK